MQCKPAGIKRVSFTGGEPFLNPDFLYRITRLAVRKGFLFGRIMTNGVWYKNKEELESVLTKLYEAGYDGDICVSADAFHLQDIKKVSVFIKTAAAVWRRPDIISIAWVGGSREKETGAKLKKILHEVKKLPIKTARIPLTPISERLAGQKNPWGNVWFKEDYCRGPGNALFVLPDGDVKPCCGYATDEAGLTIGNIKRESALEIIDNARHNDFVRAVFSVGLSGIRKRLEKLGVSFPGKTENHCFFCHYLLTKVPKDTLKKALKDAKLAVMGVMLSALLASYSFAETIVLKKSKGYHSIPVKVIKKIDLPKWYHEGLYLESGSIWVVNGEKGNVWVVDTSSGKMTSEIVPPAGFTESIIKSGEGKYLFTDWDEKKLCEASLKDGRMATEKVLFDFSPSHPAGLGYIDGALYVVIWKRGMGTKFEMVKLDNEFKEAGRIDINEIQEPAHIAWDGRNLWITGWYNRRVYRVDPVNWEITASFRAPFNKVTGIAWDGRYFWITGTYADLYQVELSEPAAD